MFSLTDSFFDALMVKVPGGEIQLKNEGANNIWNVEVKPFLIAKYPVTKELYFYVTQDISNFSDKNKPHEEVSWNEAIKFCNLLSQQVGLKECYSKSDNGEKIVCNWEANGFRLPTEAEWEYACRAGNTETRYGDIDKIAWYNENSGGKTQNVGEKEPNNWGLYDMIGNVWEWCWDLYDEKVYGSYRVFRGGGWSDPARGCRASCRRKSHPTFHIDDLGFRIARSLYIK